MIQLFLETRSEDTSSPFQEQKRREAHLQSRNLSHDEIRCLPCVPVIDKAVRVEVGIRKYPYGKNAVYSEPDSVSTCCLHFTDLIEYFIGIVTEPLRALPGIISSSVIKHLDTSYHIDRTTCLSQGM